MYLYTRPQCKAGFLLLYRYYFSFYLRFISSLVISSYFSILECKCTWRKYRVLPYLTSVMCVNLSFAMVLDNTTSPDYQLCVKTMHQACDKEIVEVPWYSTLWQRFYWKTCCHLMYTCLVYVCKLCLKNHWVTLYPWVCHLKCSLCLLALPNESLGYTAPMGVPPKVQPMFVSST